MFNFEKLDVWQKSISFATGSVFEVVSQARIARTQGWLNEHDYERMDSLALEIVRMLSGLRTSLAA